MMRRLPYRVKKWWDIWVFVIGFPLGLVFAFFFWGYLLHLSANPIWIIAVSIFCLYGVIILVVSTIIAISENNIFISSFILLLVGVTIAILGYFYTRGSFQLDTDKLINDFYANISTELISVVITVLAIETLKDRLHWRNYQREKQSQEMSIAQNPDQQPEPANEGESARLGAQSNSSIRTVEILGSVLIGVIIGLVIRQSGKDFPPKNRL
jgi:hypothetical protein